MGNETSAPNGGVEGGALSPPDQAGADPAAAAAVANGQPPGGAVATPPTSGGSDPLGVHRQQQQQQQHPQQPFHPQQQHQAQQQAQQQQQTPPLPPQQAQGTPPVPPVAPPQPSSALQVRQQQIRNAAKRGVERTKANMEKTKSVFKQGTAMRRGSAKRDKMGTLAAATAAAAAATGGGGPAASGEPSENGSAGGMGGGSGHGQWPQQTAPLHHQHSAPPPEGYAGAGKSGGSGHQRHYQQQPQPQQQPQQQYYQQQRHPASTPSGKGGGGGGGRGNGNSSGDPRRSPRNTAAVVDVMYASEVHNDDEPHHDDYGYGFGGGPGSLAGGTAGLGAAASQMADTAAAFAASLSTQMGQLGISASEAAAAAVATADASTREAFGAFSISSALPQQMQQQGHASQQQQQQQQMALAQGQRPQQQQGQGQGQRSQRGAYEGQQQRQEQPPGLDSAGAGGYKTEGLSNDEDEWKNAWDEDEEESDDAGDDDEEEDSDGDGGKGSEEDVLAGLGGPLALSGPGAGPGGKPPKGGNAGSGPFGAASAMAAAAAAGSHQPFRPAMDGGHSSSAASASASSSVTSGAGAAAMAGQWGAHPSAAAGYGSGRGVQPPPPPHYQQHPHQQHHQHQHPQYQRHQQPQHHHPQQRQQQQHHHVGLQHQMNNIAYYPASGRPAQPQQGGGVPMDHPSLAPGGYPAAQPQLQPRSAAAGHPGAVGAATPPLETEEDVLKREADRVLSAGNGAVPWEMAAAAGAATASQQQQRESAVAAAPPPEKPCVEMFFPMLRVLGKGSFGKVVLVQKRTGKERGGLFAMKILRKAHLVKRRQIERTKTERKVLSLVDHPFIMKLHYAFQTDDKLYLVLDYCPGGELFFHLSRFRRFPERVARFFAAELLLALGHLHKRGIIYRDLKPENVLLDADGHVKLGDFGLAKDRISHPCAGATSMCGTPEYMAPEVLSQQGHGFCVDYWGLGMLTYEMMTGLPPWYTTDRTKLFRRLRSAPLDVPSFFSAQSASFASALLERDPRRRLGVQGLRSAMAHEFFRDVDWSALRFRKIEAPIRPCEGWRAPGGPGAAAAGGGNANHHSHSAAVPAGSPPPSGAGGGASQNQISQNELDVATANFDPQFTRMAVDTEDAGRPDDNAGGGGGGGGAGGEGGAEETLNENTFVGFTFDEMDPTRGSVRGSENARTRGGHGPPVDPRAYRSSRRN